MKFSISAAFLTILSILFSQTAVAGVCSSKPKPSYVITSNTFFVNAQNSYSGDGTSWEKAFKTIKEAVDAVIKVNQSGTPLALRTIAVAQGTYRFSDQIERHNDDGSLRIKALIHYENMPMGLSIVGGFVPGKGADERSDDPTLTVLQGGSDGIRAILASFDTRAIKANLTIDGFTIKEFGNQGFIDRGGAISLTGGNIVIKKVIFKDNMAKKGGALWIDTATVLFDQCTFVGNKAEQGGAINIFVSNPALAQGLYLTSCTIGGEGNLSNSAINGGFIYARQEQSIVKITYTKPKYGEIPSIDNQIITTAESKN